MRPLLFTIALALLAGACRKESSFDYNPYWNCNKAQQLDSAGVRQKLIGAWKWTGYAASTGRMKKAGEAVLLTFNDDGSFSLLETDAITGGTWTLVPIGTDGFRLSLSPANRYTNGRILFCNNELLFNASYIDGEDHLFQRE